MERITTGIKGLDEILEGGFPFPSVTILAGEPGAGKTTFSLQTLFHGADKGEKGLYVSAISEPAEQMHRFMSRYGFYSKLLVDKGAIRFMDISDALFKMGAETALKQVVEAVQRTNARRVVIDSITPFSYMFKETQRYRKFLHEFFLELKNLKTFTIVCAEFSPSEVAAVENYMADGVIFLYLQQADTNVFKPGLQIRKMKGTEHTKDILRMGFTKEGLRLL